MGLWGWLWGGRGEVQWTRNQHLLGRDTKINWVLWSLCLSYFPLQSKQNKIECFYQPERCIHMFRNILNIKKWQMRATSSPTLLTQRENRLFPPGLSQSGKLLVLRNVKGVVHNVLMEMYSCFCACLFWLCFYTVVVNTISLSLHCSSKSGETAVPEDICAPRMMKKVKFKVLKLKLQKI